MIWRISLWFGQIHLLIWWFAEASIINIFSSERTLGSILQLLNALNTLFLGWLVWTCSHQWVRACLLELSTSVEDPSGLSPLLWTRLHNGPCQSVHEFLAVWHPKFFSVRPQTQMYAIFILGFVMVSPSLDILVKNQCSSIHCPNWIVYELFEGCVSCAPPLRDCGSSAVLHEFRLSIQKVGLKCNWNTSSHGINLAVLD